MTSCGWRFIFCHTISPGTCKEAEACRAGSHYLHYTLTKWLEHRKNSKDLFTREKNHKNIHNPKVPSNKGLQYIVYGGCSINRYGIIGAKKPQAHYSRMMFVFVLVSLAIMVMVIALLWALSHIKYVCK